STSCHPQDEHDSAASAVRRTYQARRSVGGSVSSPEPDTQHLDGRECGGPARDSRIVGLRRSGAQVKFLSCEPLLGPLQELDLQGIDWVIVGGESGRKPRPMKEEWVLEIQRQCKNGYQIIGAHRCAV